MNSDKMKTTSDKKTPPKYIGGQAVIEGVMMRGKKTYTLAVRTPEDEIFTENKEVHSISDKYPALKLPLIRGVVSFVESLVMGMKIITRSAEIAGLDIDQVDEDELSKFEKFLSEKFGDKFNDIVMGFSVFLAILLSVGLFMLLPVFISGLIRKVFPFESRLLLSAVEGIVKIIIFVAYLYLITMMDDIKRVLMYHGAEHKTINCFENEEELTVENVRKYSRLHKRCGTSFLFLVMIVSIIIFMFVRTDVLLLRVLSRILLIPLVAGISYEILRWAGSSDSAFVNMVSKPGMLLQKLSTKEPDDEMIEVAIASVKGVLEAEPELS